MKTSAISSVIKSISDAVIGLGDKSALEGWKPMSASSAPLTPDEIKKFMKLVSNHRKSLNHLHVLAGQANAWKLEAAESTYLGSHSARACAVVRALRSKRVYASAAEIDAVVKALDVWTPLSETVNVVLAEKPKGGWRTIVVFGLRRIAQQLIVRDLLDALGIDSEFDFTRKNAGGEKAFIAKICKEIVDERNWWFVADVKNCFPSLKAKHFDGLPIPEQIVRNVVFLPKCAKIRIYYPKEKSPHTSPDNLKQKLPSKSFLIRLVRQGLPTGAVVSPLLARSLLGRELQGLGEKWDVARSSFVDDLAIGAWSQTDAKSAFDALKTRLSLLPAGPLELHAKGPTFVSKKGFDVLGYRLLPGEGYGNNPVHVKPGAVRIERHKRKLAIKLSEAAKAGIDLNAVGEAYWKSWYASQQAWTKVPGHSCLISWIATQSYVQDFKAGIPMGQNAPILGTMNHKKAGSGK
ncbi:hypothetical protein [Mesorhizobium sp. WSM3882]|uniref:hypothetical protein n=1 Tax=Mesorhizobium sp. WSM3882 TaxID=2029407 RepID=UPI000BB044DE|nr:hypothetical protein [Mesorhizobium sp. WSM3882]PBB34329.1 hypothetical protein CK214_08455 [Mesorhizobium sp. WSM3882]